MGITKGPWRVEEDIRTESDRRDESGFEYLAGYNIVSDEGEIVGIEGIIPGGNALDNAQAIAALPELIEELEWYGEQARLARLIHSEGDAGRHALQDDGGKRARAILSRLETCND